MVTMLIGFAGGLAVLVSFAGVASGRLSTHSAAYHGMNLAGAVAMVFAGVPADAWPSVAVNGSWALISANGLGRAVTPPRPARERLAGVKRRAKVPGRPWAAPGRASSAATSWRGRQAA
jgi:hypothetical protein